VIWAQAIEGAPDVDVMGFSVLQGGAAGLVVLIVVLILRGRLVPRSVLRDTREVYEARLADKEARVKEITQERDTWRIAYETSAAGHHLTQRQVDELLELSRTAAHVLTSLPKAELGVTAGAGMGPETVAPPP
jgi:uncharacterized membrane protein YhiD involved in acid resistance